MYRYYKCCTAIKRGADACPGRSIPANQIESMIVDQIREIAKDTVLLDEVDNQVSLDLTEEIDELKTQMRQLDKQIKRDMAELARLEKSESRAEVTVDRISELQKRMRVSTTDRDSIKQEINKASRIHDGVIHPRVLQDFDSVWASMPTQDRCLLVSMVVERIDFNPDDDGLSVTISSEAAGILSRKQPVIK